MSGIHPAHCEDGCHQGAGPSMVKRHKVCRSRARTTIVTCVMTAAVLFSQALAVPSGMADRPAASMSQLLAKRQDLKSRDSTAAMLREFDIGLSQPSTCELMNITFNTAGGKPPYTIFIGFENWFATTVSLPSTYADSDVSTWLYQFPIPYFNGTATSPSNPHTIVTVGDSTGALLNSSEFKQVQSLRSDCAYETGSLNFTFWTDNNPSAVCSDVGVHWSPWSNTSTWTDPLSLYLVPAQLPPVHVPVLNSTLGSLNYTLDLQPGTFFSFTMTDAHGSGGVSGYNLAGIDEYIGTDCLKSPNQYGFAMPSPTATIATTVRMPYFSGTVSSLVTSNGVVSTATSIEVVNNGSVLGNNLDTGEIAGIAVGIAVVAALIAALVSWCVWRRRHGRQTTFWDVPKGMDGELGKGEMSGPIDRRLLKAMGAQNNPSTGSMTGPILAQHSVQSDSGEEIDRAVIPVASDSSFVDSSHDGQNSSPPYDGTFSIRRGSNGPQSANTNSIGSSWSASHRYVSVPLLEGNSFPPTSTTVAEGSIAPAASQGVLPVSARHRSSSTTGGSIVGASNTQISRTGGSSRPVPNSSARSYRVQSIDIDDSGSRHSTSDPSASNSMMGSHLLDASNRRSVPSQRMSPTHSQSGSASDHLAAARMPQVVQHRDAGLLMDDSLDDEALMGRVELPPSYHQIERPGIRDPSRSSLRNTMPLQNGTHSQGLQTSRPQEVDEDESEFWRTPAAT